MPLEMRANDTTSENWKKNHWPGLFINKIKYPPKTGRDLRHPNYHVPVYLYSNYGNMSWHIPWTLGMLRMHIYQILDDLGVKGLLLQVNFLGDHDLCHHCLTLEISGSFNKVHWKVLHQGPRLKWLWNIIEMLSIAVKPRSLQSP